MGLLSGPAPYYTVSSIPFFNKKLQLHQGQGQGLTLYDQTAAHLDLQGVVILGSHHWNV